MTSQNNNNSAVNQMSGVYDDATRDIGKLENDLITIFSTNYQQLEEKLDKKQLLSLLTHLMYTLQSATYLYSTVGQKEMAPQFAKVEEYFKKVQALVNGSSNQPKQKINKQAANRMLKQQI